MIDLFKSIVWCNEKLAPVGSPETAIEKQIMLGSRRLE